MNLYRFLLHLLPRHRRERDGDAMAVVFDDLRRATRREEGLLGLGILWMKETGGLMKFSLRERLGRREGAAGSPQTPRGRWDFASELKWAWRAVRARGWRAGLIVGLISVALAANTLMFAVADSLVFNLVPYQHADRLVEIQIRQVDEPDSRVRFLPVPVFEEWQRQTDLFSGVYGYQHRTTFVVGHGTTERLRTADVTPGLIEALGVRPAWGRSLTASDGRDAGVDTVLISEALARRQFGTPNLAPGRQLETLTVPLLVVGVMPASFSFPDGTCEVWRALEVRGPLLRDTGGLYSISRVAPGITLDALSAAMAQRSPVIAAATGQPAGSVAEPIGPETRTHGSAVFYVLLGAAMCLLLTACANVASLELAGALQRSRTYAVQLALGASRAMIARVAFLEGAVVIGIAALLAAPLIVAGIEVLNTSVLGDLRLRTANPIDVDGRLAFYMLCGAAATWLLISLPTVFHASRSNLLELLKLEDRSMAASRTGARIRTGLTVAEIALAVLLVTGGVLYTRTYLALLALDKGFDSSNLVEIGFTMPGSYRPNVSEGSIFSEEVRRRLLAVPGVLGVTLASAPPGTGDSPSRARLEIDDRPQADQPVLIGRKWVDEMYREVIGLPLHAGRWLTSDDPSTNVVITESFARRFWPGENVVGRKFRENPSRPWNTVVGVVGDARVEARFQPGPGDEQFHVYAHFPNTAGPATARKPVVPARDTGAVTRFTVLTVRLDARHRGSAALAAAGSVDPRLRVTLEFVDDLYASQFSDTLLATRVVGAFAGLAFVVSIAGVYGVMAFLVAGRTREIGIRMALGADGRDISRLVLRSSVTMVAIGAGIGVIAALIVSRWTGSQFFGVTPTAPGTYVLVTAAVVATSILATWRPARAAARVDPAITLRTE